MHHQEHSLPFMCHYCKSLNIVHDPATYIIHHHPILRYQYLSTSTKPNKFVPTLTLTHPPPHHPTSLMKLHLESSWEECQTLLSNDSHQTLNSTSSDVSHNCPYTTCTIYHSSLVFYSSPCSPTIHRGSLRITYSDEYAHDPQPLFIWKPHQTDPFQPLHHSCQAVVESVHHFLTIRLQLQTSPPRLTIHLKGARRLGTFSFPTGVKEVLPLLNTLREYFYTVTLCDVFYAGELFLLELKQCNAHATTHCAMDCKMVANDEDDHLASLLCDVAVAHEGEQIKSPWKRLAEKRKIEKCTTRDTYTSDQESAYSHFPGSFDARHDFAAENLNFAPVLSDGTSSCSPMIPLKGIRRVPICLSAWEDELDCNGRLRDPTVIKQTINSGGLHSDARCTVWPFILGYYPWKSSKLEREVIDNREKRRYEALKSRWMRLRAAAAVENRKASGKESIGSRRRKSDRLSKVYADCLRAEAQIHKDVIRTDRHLDLYKDAKSPALRTMGLVLNVYASYNKRINYCQGMSDFLSALICALGEEEEEKIFWCFVRLMERVESNFDIEQSGIRYQLSQLRRIVSALDPELSAFLAESDPEYHSFFRWLLVLFKRELTLESVLHLWEVLWTRNHGGEDLQIFVAAGILKTHREELLCLPVGAFDCILRWVNDKTLDIDINSAIREGELLYRRYGAMIR